MMQKSQGFTLIELMIVVAIIAILAAIAIPAYNGYILTSKTNATRSNFDAAHRLIANEGAKKAAGADATTDVVALLNQGDKKSPFNSNIAAFIALTGDCAAATNDAQIAISATTININMAATNAAYGVLMCDDTGNTLSVEFASLVGTGITISIE